MIETRTIGRTFDATLIIHDKCKYFGENETKVTRRYGVVNFQIVTGEEAAEIEAQTDGSFIDDYHEYLVLNYKDGTKETFRNSYVDMFTVLLNI